MLPKPQGVPEPPPPSTPIPGTIPNTNPPAAGPGDALIFDPDENITYDPLQTMQRTSDVPPTPVIPEAVSPSRNVIDLEPTTPAPSGMGMGFWVVLVAVLIVLSIIVFFVVRSMTPSRAPTTTTAASPLNQMGYVQ
jgi:hypothetical protein